MKLLLGFIISLNILLASENNNIVKTSELELFLFKVGFESLLKDVGDTKKNSTINSEELRLLRSKVEMIMNEVYKEKRVISETSSIGDNISYNKEIEDLKNEVALLKFQISNLSKSKEINIKNTENNNFKELKVIADKVNVRNNSSLNGEIVDVLKKDTVVIIESCDKFDWCKLKNEDKYISKNLLNF